MPCSFTAFSHQMTGEKQSMQHITQDMGSHGSLRWSSHAGPVYTVNTIMGKKKVKKRLKDQSK